MVEVADELAQRRAAAADGGDEDEKVEEPSAVGEGGTDGSESASDDVAKEEDPGPKLLQESLPGDWKAISDAFGGDSPTVSEIRLLGGSIPLEGSFSKGQELDLLVKVRVSEVHGVDVLDGWGRTKHTIRRHRARLISVRRANR